jgi:hypothetical protein
LTFALFKHFQRPSSSGGETGRPKWARIGMMSSSQLVHNDAIKDNSVLAKITRPGPVSPSPKRVKKSSSRPATARTAREVPSM